MTQEEKQLLLVDLCARLPYNVKGTWYNSERISILSPSDIDMFNIEDFKPYLRPMSSMTDEEREEWTDLFNSELDKLMSIEDEKQAEDLAPNYFAASHSASICWLNKKLFDYRGLIEKGLALESTEMYKKD